MFRLSELSQSPRSKDVVINFEGIGKTAYRTMFKSGRIHEEGQNRPDLASERSTLKKPFLQTLKDKSVLVGPSKEEKLKESQKRFFQNTGSSFNITKANLMYADFGVKELIRKKGERLESERKAREEVLAKKQVYKIRTMPGRFGDHKTIDGIEKHKEKVVLGHPDKLQVKMGMSYNLSNNQGTGTFLDTFYKKLMSPNEGLDTNRGLRTDLHLELDDNEESLNIKMHGHYNEEEPEIVKELIECQVPKKLGWAVRGSVFLASKSPVIIRPAPFIVRPETMTRDAFLEKEMAGQRAEQEELTHQEKREMAFIYSPLVEELNKNNFSLKSQYELERIRRQKFKRVRLAIQDLAHLLTVTKTKLHEVALFHSSSCTRTLSQSCLSSRDMQRNSSQPASSATTTP